MKGYMAPEYYGKPSTYVLHTVPHFLLAPRPPIEIVAVKYGIGYKKEQTFVCNYQLDNAGIKARAG